MRDVASMEMDTTQHRKAVACRRTPPPGLFPPGAAFYLQHPEGPATLLPVRSGTSSRSEPPRPGCSEGLLCNARNNERTRDADHMAQGGRDRCDP